MHRFRLFLLALICTISITSAQDREQYQSKIDGWFATKIITSVASYLPYAFVEGGPAPVLISSLGIGIVDVMAPFKMDNYAQLAQGRGPFRSTRTVSDYRRRYRRLFWFGASATFATSLLPTGIILDERSSTSGNASFTYQVTFNPVSAVVNSIFDVATIAVMSKQRRGVHSLLADVDFGFQMYTKNDVETYKLSVCFPL